MKQKMIHTPPAPMPERPEFRELPEAPRLIMEAARLLKHRVRSGESAEGCMAQHAARALMAHLAVAGSISQLTLADRTRFSTPTVSVLLRKMEAEGYVCRIRDPQDGRVMLVSLTEKGRAFDREHLSRISENDKRAMAGFTPAEEALLADMLRRISANLKER